VLSPWLLVNHKVLATALVIERNPIADVSGLLTHNWPIPEMLGNADVCSLKNNEPSTDIPSIVILPDIVFSLSFN
jgi:hypothetical protein